MQKIWICGAGGRVGRQITKLLEHQPAELLLTDIDSVDITVSGDVMEYAGMNRPHYIINCAGLTDPLLREKDKEKAFQVNALGAKNLSVAARMGKARLAGFDARVMAVEAGEDTLSAMRPSCSVLDNMMLRISGMDLLPDWRSMLEAYMVRWRRKYQKGSAGR